MAHGRAAITEVGVIAEMVAGLGPSRNKKGWRAGAAIEIILLSADGRGARAAGGGGVNAAKRRPAPRGIAKTRGWKQKISAADRLGELRGQAWPKRRAGEAMRCEKCF